MLPRGLARSCSPRRHAQQAGAIDQAGVTRRSSKLIARLLAAPDYALRLRPLAGAPRFAGAAFLAAAFLAGPRFAAALTFGLRATAFFARACLTWMRSTLR